MRAWPRLSLATGVAVLIGVLGCGVAGAVPPPTTPWGAEQPQQAPQPLGACLRPPSQPQLWYDTNVCCKAPESWRQACILESATLPTGSSPGTASCLQAIWVCTAPPPKH